MSDAKAEDTTISSAQGEYDSLRYVSAETPCPYLKGRQSRSEAYVLEDLDGERYERLLTLGYRRSGRVIYRPRCRGCQECRSLRVPIADFVPTRSMRRVWRQNNDVRVEMGEAVADAEKFEMFCRYLDHQHDDTMSRTYEAFEEFLYQSPIDTREFRYLLGDRLIGVSVADRWNSGLSSVYMYFDPDFATRSLGTYSVLWEIEQARRDNLRYYYLGYYVAGSKTMAYKARFRPHEILVGDDRWITFRE